MISLDEMKNYLRIDFDDDDALLENLIVSSVPTTKRHWLCVWTLPE